MYPWLQILEGMNWFQRNFFLILTPIMHVYTLCLHFVYPVGKESVSFAVHPKRNKLLYLYPDMHPDTTITQYVI